MSTPPVPPPPGTPILSWAPYGRGATTVVVRTVPMSPVMSTRVSMAPVQVTRSMRGESGPAVTMAPVSMSPVTMSPVPAPPMPTPAPPVRTAPRTARPPAPTAPRTAAPSTRYRTAEPQAAPRTAAPTAFESTTQRTAARRTHRPTQAERTAARGARAAARGLPMPPPPPPRPSTTGYPRPVPVESRVPFDPLAIVAIIASFFFGPVGLFLAITSIGRARKSGASIALSVIALLVGVAMTTSQFGLAGMLGDLGNILP